jgi:hypothetical protein
MCACTETDVRESASDCTLAGGEGLGSRGETLHPICAASPCPHPLNALYCCMIIGLQRVPRWFAHTWPRGWCAKKRWGCTVLSAGSKQKAFSFIERGRTKVLGYILLTFLKNNNLCGTVQIFGKYTNKSGLLYSWRNCMKISFGQNLVPFSPKLLSSRQLSENVKLSLCLTN